MVKLFECPHAPSSATDLPRLNRSKTAPLCERYVVRLQVSNVLARNCSTVPPSRDLRQSSRAHLSHSLDHLCGTWKPSIFAPSLSRGRQTARHTVGNAGLRCRKKRMPFCNGMDIPPGAGLRKGADVRRVSNCENTDRTILRKESKRTWLLSRCVRLPQIGLWMSACITKLM